jgi:hypothetical protein
MNDNIKKLYEDASLVDGLSGSRYSLPDEFVAKFAQLIVRECARLNRLQSYELLGVITDVEEGDGFDDVCLSTVKRVAEHLANDLKQHFGVEL